MANHPGAPGARLRTAVAADLPELQRVFAQASLSNPGDAPLLQARPEFLHFAGEGIAEGHTRVVTTARGEGRDRVLGFATVSGTPDDDGLELVDLFVDPEHRRLGVARELVLDAAARGRAAGHVRLWVTGNPHAEEFYRAVGFVEVGRATTELGSGFRMQLDLLPG